MPDTIPHCLSNCGIPCRSIAQPNAERHQYCLAGRCWARWRMGPTRRPYFFGPVAGDAVGGAVLDACREEIETYREFSAYYGYLFLVMSAGPPSPLSS